MIIKSTIVVMSFLLSFWLDGSQIGHLNGLGQSLNLVAFKCGFYDIDCVSNFFKHMGLIIFQNFDKIQNDLIYVKTAHVLWSVTYLAYLTIVQNSHAYFSNLHRLNRLPIR
jgi:exosortase/archaeosortase